MIHWLLLLIHLNKPYFHNGDKICEAVDDGPHEFSYQQSFWAWKIDAVGNSHYLVENSMFNCDPEVKTEYDISVADRLYHICTEKEWKNRI